MSHRPVKWLKLWIRINLSLVLLPNPNDSLCMLTMHLIKKSRKIRLKVSDIISDLFLSFTVTCCWLFCQSYEFIWQWHRFCSTFWVVAIGAWLINRWWPLFVIIWLNLIAIAFYFHLVLLVCQDLIVILSDNMLLFLYFRLESLEQILPHMIFFSFISHLLLFNNIFRIHVFL